MPLLLSLFATLGAQLRVLPGTSPTGRFATASLAGAVRNYAVPGAHDPPAGIVARARKEQIAPSLSPSTNPWNEMSFNGSTSIDASQLAAPNGRARIHGCGSVFDGRDSGFARQGDRSGPEEKQPFRQGSEETDHEKQGGWGRDSQVEPREEQQLQAACPK